MINKNYSKMSDNYLFTEINRRAEAYILKNPDKRLIKMGIGDVTLPLCPIIGRAMSVTAENMTKPEEFRGYCPEQGYGFARAAVAGYYGKRGIKLTQDEIFISSGAKDDLGNLLDIFDRKCTVLLSDPVYPVYADTNIMDGRKIEYMPATSENNYLPMPPDKIYDIVYLCSPNNPCGTAYSIKQLQCWVDWANRNGAVIFFDAAYEAYVRTPGIARSIYETDGAENCAIEICSLSKTAGFTGLRCGWTVVPAGLVRDGERLSKLWLRCQTTKFNGVSYITQRGAEAFFTSEGQLQAKERLDYYYENAKLLSDSLDKLGLRYSGGSDSPYLWLSCPQDMKSWDFFDLLLDRIQILGTPGVGFGNNGEGHLRLTSFSSRDNTLEAIKRLKTLSL